MTPSWFQKPAASLYRQEIVWQRLYLPWFLATRAPIRLTISSVRPCVVLGHRKSSSEERCPTSSVAYTPSLRWRAGNPVIDSPPEQSAVRLSAMHTTMSVLTIPVHSSICPRVTHRFHQFLLVKENAQREDVFPRLTLIVRSHGEHQGDAILKLGSSVSGSLLREASVRTSARTISRIR